MSKGRIWVVDLIISSSGVSKASAELIVDRLTEEGCLSYGYGNKDIDTVVESFSENFGTTKVSRYDRWAANRLASKYGTQTVVGVIRHLAQQSTEMYAPVVGSVSQLESKWVSVLHFLRSRQKEEVIQI